MPAFDYECPDGHINEYFLSKYTERVQCQDCGQEATYRPSFYYSSRASQAFNPVVIHKDAQGNVRFPGDSNAPVPQGFEKVELRTAREVYAFEREVNARDERTAINFHAAQEQDRQGQLRASREELARIRAGGAWNGVENGHEVIRHGLSERGHKFYEAMREQSEKRRHEAKRPEFVIEAFNYDASNRNEYHSGGRFERGRK